jgi:hypothetical protein
MDEIVKGVFAAPLATVFVVAGMIFLLIAVVGNISGKIEPGAKGRVISRILGLAFIITGLAMHLTHQAPQIPIPFEKALEKSEPFETPQTPRASSPMVKSDREVSGLAAQTIFEGVVANVTRFEKTGELVTLELTLQNAAPDTVSFCVEPYRAELIDELTGDSWREVHHGGIVTCSSKQELAMGQSHIAWMKFEGRNPEKKRFAFSLPILRRPVENLVLEKR